MKREKYQPDEDLNFFLQPHKGHSAKYYEQPAEAEMGLKIA